MKIDSRNQDILSRQRYEDTRTNDRERRRLDEKNAQRRAGNLSERVLKEWRAIGHGHEFGRCRIGAHPITERIFEGILRAI